MEQHFQVFETAMGQVGMREQIRGCEVTMMMVLFRVLGKNAIAHRYLPTTDGLLVPW